MSYTIHRSPAFVIGHRPRGESDREIILLTQEHGIIRARAKNIRAESSRLRYGTQFLAYGTFEYVRGKHLWRLTGAHEASYPCNEEKCALICGDLIRLIQGEEPCRDIFDALNNLLAQPHSYHDVIRKRAEILGMLGYLDVDKLPEVCHAQNEKTFTRAIDQALVATGL